MTALTSLTEAAGSSPSSSDYYIWDEPESSVSVHLNYQMVERLQVEVLRGLDANGDGGAEIGGILLGRREKIAGRINTFVEQFVPVECANSSGSAYSLSKRDVLKFDVALKRCQFEAGNSSSVLGFFRSHLRDDVFLSPDDLILIRRFFPDPDSVFLLIKALPSRGCTAAFFFWENGQMQPECAYSEVPLSPVQTGPLAYREKQTAEVRRPAQKVPDVPRRRVAGTTAVAVAVVSISVGAGGYWMKWGQRPGTPASADLLGLHIERSSDRLALLWNRNSPELASANRAVLSIRDGSDHRELSLTQPELRAGRATYKPDHQNIAFELELYRDRTPVVRDTLHVFLENAPQATSAGPSPGFSEVQAPTVSPKSAPVIAVVKRGDSAPASSTPVSSRTFKLPPQAVQTPIGSALTDVPTDALAVQSPGLPVNPKILPELTQKINWPVSAPVQVPPAPQKAPPPQPAAPAAPRRSTYVGPQVLQRVSPTLSEQVRSMMSSDIEVDVTVSIDTNGAVTDARVASTKGSLAGLVGAEALQAARLFRFRPARENGRNIVSEMTLSFRFRR